MSDSLPLGAKAALVISGLFGLLFTLMGIAWLVQPARIAEALGASLLVEGTGLATQIGDSSSFFLCSGLFLLYGALKRSAPFLVAGGLLIGLVAPARLIAWQIHGAALTLDKIGPEVITLVAALAAAAAVRSRA
jgi:hypothetical protein